MDTQDKLENVLKAVRAKREAETKFLGVDVKASAIQKGLDELDTDARVHRIQDDLSFELTNRVNELAEESKNNDEDANSICEE